MKEIKSISANRYLSYLTNSFCHIFFVILSSFMKLNALKSKEKNENNDAYYKF